MKNTNAEQNNSNPYINIVWFKRDLRLRDHEPLGRATQNGLPTLLCFFFEPSVMNAPESDARHWRFIYESIQDLQAQLSAFNDGKARLYWFHSEVIPVFEAIQQYYSIQNIYSHQETGLKITFDRDLAVKKFCKKNNIQWQEFGQDGVQRGSKNRKGWNKKVNLFFKTPLIKNELCLLNPLQLTEKFYTIQKGEPLPPEMTTPHPHFQKGGERKAWQYMRSFFEQRYPKYFKNISKPAPSRYTCSRLSPYLAFGNLSAKQVYQYSEWLLQKENITNRKTSRHPINQFQSRVWWRSHFIQKLETEYQIEFEAINKALKNIPRELDKKKFEAWATGKTGYPMVDANMRCLAATGYTNFRMRAMLVSFATFPLWLPWKAVATHLAQLFLDFEPGIHFAQFQMQAGLTGYNTLRIYNPTHQVKKHDQQGEFIKKWLPELRDVPTQHLPEPWKMTEMEQVFYNCKIGTDYPAPIVHFEAAAKMAKDIYWKYRTSAAAQYELRRVLALHCIPNQEKNEDMG